MFSHSSFRGASEAREPGIQKSEIPGLRPRHERSTFAALAHPGMTL